MAEKKGCKDCPDTGRDMSRGEFLKTSAVAAGGVAMGGGVEAAGVAPIRSPRPPDTCPGEIRWAVPAGVLNVLWADIYPRLVAAQWRWQSGDPNPLSLPGPGPHPILWPGMTRSKFVERIRALPARQGSEFDRRKRLVSEYFGWGNDPDNAPSIPISVVGWNGFDFLLNSGSPVVPSNAKANPDNPADRHPNFDVGGLELFIPMLPDQKEELYRFFSYRRTGRPALGLPRYLDGKYSAVSIDGPTGPNRLETPTHDLTPQEQACGGAVDLRRARRGGDGEEVFVIELDGIESYKCAKKSSRCWQLEGAVYRALATEAPRIVAVIWQEHAGGISQPRYLEMFEGQVVPDGLRKLFEERLEVTLPQAREMDCRLHHEDSTIPDYLVGFRWDDNSNEPELRRDLIVTNTGFHFPSLPNGWRSFDLVNDLMRDLMEGKAGNPVFTSSERTLLF